MIGCMDYRELLKKYLRHVSEEEGVYFINTHNLEKYFTVEDQAELQILVEELEEDA